MVVIAITSTAIVSFGLGILLMAIMFVCRKEKGEPWILVEDELPDVDPAGGTSDWVDVTDGLRTAEGYYVNSGRKQAKGA